MSEPKKAKPTFLVSEVFPVRPEDALPGQFQKSTLHIEGRRKNFRLRPYNQKLPQGGDQSRSQEGPEESLPFSGNHILCARPSSAKMPSRSSR